MGKTGLRRPIKQLETDVTGRVGPALVTRTGMETAEGSGMPISIRAQGGQGCLCSEQWVTQPLQDVFAFFADPYNPERITPPFLRFRVLAVSTPVMTEGTNKSPLLGCGRYGP
jgi:hypothetical protein